MSDRVDLQSRESIAKLDEHNMLGSVSSLAEQVQDAWETTKTISFTATADIHHVVVAGMGGSALGADVVKHLFKDGLTVPLDLARDYTLPAYVNQHTLVVLSSYSGTTEETLACAEQAQVKGAQIMVISAGGDLIELATTNHYTYYQVNPQYNPSGQPRAAIGYAVIGLISLLSKAGLITVTDAQVDEVIETIRQITSECQVEVSQDENPAKLLAFSMFDKRPVIAVADFLEGAAHVAANTTNENAKAFADYKVLPEINHHLMEGLRFPASNQHNHLFIFIMSLLYHPRNRTRIELTQEIVEDNGIETLQVPLKASSKLAQTFELITLFAFASLYLSLLEGINPSLIPFVDRFKEELGKRS
jgi:glucose/mannose-6-phosphate isomerase